LAHILIAEGKYVPAQNIDSRPEFFVGQLIRYSSSMPFPMNNLKLGLIVKKVNIKQYLREMEENPNDHVDRGFMEEWTFYIRLREALMIPPTSNEYIEERERMLERVLDPDAISNGFLYKVLWNNGVEYIEHPEDIILYENQAYGSVYSSCSEDSEDNSCGEDTEDTEDTEDIKSIIMVGGKEE